MEIPQKLNQAVLYDAEIPLLDIYPKYWNKYVKRYLQSSDYCSTIHNSLAVETT
jgi:hypothetical protein